MSRTKSEDLRLTVFKFDAATGGFSRVSSVFEWQSTSVGNPVTITYPAHASTELDRGAYTLMIHRGTEYVISQNFRISNDWADAANIIMPTIDPGLVRMVPAPHARRAHALPR